MNKLTVGVLLLMAVAFFSCETDIDINAEPTDITVVYGLIDPADTVHYIKINKVFSGEANAYELALNASNYNYAEGEIRVTVEGNNNVYTLIRVTDEIPKDAGIFDNSSNVLYKFTEPSINNDAIYTLKIVNTLLNKEVTSSTRIVKESGVGDPKRTNELGFWSGNISTGNYIPENVSVSFGENIGRVQAFMIFNYIEHYTSASGKNSVQKKVTINLGEKKSASTSNNQLSFLLKGQTFFSSIVSAIAAPSAVPDFSHRELENISIELSLAGTELSTYMEASAPSTTVNQNKPSYTNVINGIGIFSSRTYDASWQSTRISPSINIKGDTQRYLGTLGLGFCIGTHSTAVIPCNQI